jgi:O-antigen ligase
MAAFLEWLGSVDPDVVVLQECSGRGARVLEAFQDWHLVHDHGLCLGSRLPVTRVASVDRQSLKGWGDIAVRYAVEFQGRSVTLLNVHLETPRAGFEAAMARGPFGLDELAHIGELRAAESAMAHALLGDAGSDPVIVAGDFNMPEESAIYRRFWSGYTNAFSAAGVGLGHTKTTDWCGRRRPSSARGRPRAGLVMLYFCLLLYIAAVYVRPAEIVPALVDVPIVDILTGVALFVGAVAFLLRPRRFVPTPTDLCVVGFWGAIVVSNLAWGWFGGAWIGFLNFMPVVFCYFLVRVAVETPRQFRGLVYLLVGLNVLLAVNGIVQYHTGVGLGGVEAITEERRIRGTGIFNDPNDLGMTLVMTTPFLVAGMAAAGAQVWQRVVCSLVLAPLLLAIFYTNSRGALVGLGLVLLSYFYSRFRSVSGTVMASAAVMLLVFLGPSRISAMDASEDSAQGRIEAWAEGLQMFKAKPVFGVGYGRFTEFHGQVAHNSVVHSLSELGFLGGALFIGCFYAFFLAMRQSIGAATPGPGTANWVRALSVSAIGAIGCSLFLSRQYTIVPYILLAVGVSLATMGVGESRRFWPRPAYHSTAVVALTGASVVVTWIAVRTLGAWGQ